MKRLIAILLACALAVQPVYADNAKRGKAEAGEGGALLFCCKYPRHKDHKDPGRTAQDFMEDGQAGLHEQRG